MNNEPLIELLYQSLNLLTTAVEVEMQLAVVRCIGSWVRAGDCARRDRLTRTTSSRPRGHQYSKLLIPPVLLIALLLKMQYILKKRQTRIKGGEAPVPAGPTISGPGPRRRGHDFWQATPPRTMTSLAHHQISAMEPGLVLKQGGGGTPEFFT